MGSLDVDVAKDQFLLLINGLGEDCLSQFTIWLDIKLAEYKVNGKMKDERESRRVYPEWILRSLRRHLDAFMVPPPSSESGSTVAESREPSSNGSLSSPAFDQPMKLHGAAKRKQISRKFPEEAKRSRIEESHGREGFNTSDTGPDFSIIKVEDDTESPHVSSFDVSRTSFDGAKADSSLTSVDAGHNIYDSPNVGFDLTRHGRMDSAMSAAHRNTHNMLSHSVLPPHYSARQPVVFPGPAHDEDMSLSMSEGHEKRTEGLRALMQPQYKDMLSGQLASEHTMTAGYLPDRPDTCLFRCKPCALFFKTPADWELHLSMPQHKEKMRDLTTSLAMQDTFVDKRQSLMHTQSQNILSELLRESGDKNFKSSASKSRQEPSPSQAPRHRSRLPIIYRFFRQRGEKRELNEIPLPDLDQLLSEFFKFAKKKDGGQYSCKSKQHFMEDLRKYARSSEWTHKESIDNTSFPLLMQTYHNILQANSIRYMQRHQIIESASFAPDGYVKFSGKAVKIGESAVSKPGEVVPVVFSESGGTVSTSSTDTVTTACWTAGSISMATSAPGAPPESSLGGVHLDSQRPKQEADDQTSDNVV